MKTTTKTIAKLGLKVKAAVKAGGIFGQMGGNHNLTSLKIKTGIKAGTVIQLSNHSRRLLSLA